MAVALEESKAKSLAIAPLRSQLEQLRRIWPALRRRLREQLLPLKELKTKLSVAGAPVEPEDIGISRKRLRESFRQAWFIRRRFTVLDLAVRTGVLENSLEHIFGPNGPWPIPSGEVQTAIKKE